MMAKDFCWVGRMLGCEEHAEAKDVAKLKMLSHVHWTSMAIFVLLVNFRFLNYAWTVDAQEGGGVRLVGGWEFVMGIAGLAMTTVTTSVRHSRGCRDCLP